MKQAFAILVIMTTIPVMAADITITNSDFESQTLSDGTWTSSITGWTLSDNTGGLFNPDSNHFSFEGGSGVYGNTAYSNGATISQVLSTNLAANTTYTLTVDVGSRLDSSFPGYAVQLIADGVVLANKSGTANSIAADTFETVTLVYTTVSGDPTGEPIEIHLSSCGTQTNFDEVTLSTGDNPCADITTNFIDYDVTLNVSNTAGDFATIQDALDCLAGKYIAGNAIATIQVADGTYTNYDQIDITHPQGGRIHILGNTSDATAVKLSFASGQHGIRVVAGNRLGLVNGMTLDGYNDTQVGIISAEASFVYVGSETIVEDFATGVLATTSGALYASGVTSRNNGGNGFTSNLNGFLNAPSSVSDGNGSHGYSVSYTSSAYLNGATSKNNSGYGMNVIYNASVHGGSMTFSGNGNANENTTNGGQINN